MTEVLGEDWEEGGMYSRVQVICTRTGAFGTAGPEGAVEWGSRRKDWLSIKEGLGRGER